MELLPHEVVVVNDESIVVNKSKPGDFLVCNLASLTLGHIDVMNDKELEHIIKVAVRALDNVIDLNYYPIPYAKIPNHKYCAIGLGISDYYHMLVKLKMTFEIEQHLEFIDKLYEKINYYALKASLELSKEKGAYELFKENDYYNSDYFIKRHYDNKEWKDLKD